MRLIAVPTWILVIACILSGCACASYNYQTLFATEAEDRELAAEIKKALLETGFGEKAHISVYCYYGHVFLLGELAKNQQAAAVEIARSFKPRSITPHWFAADTFEPNDEKIASDLQAALKKDRSLSASRINIRVNGGRAVLLGVVRDAVDMQTAINTARSVPGISSVTSYLMLPQPPPAL